MEPSQKRAAPDDGSSAETETEAPIQIVTVDASDDHTITVWGRDENGVVHRRTRDNFLPYFYANVDARTLPGAECMEYAHLEHAAKEPRADRVLVDVRTHPFWHLGVPTFVVESVRRTQIMHYDKEREFYKYTLTRVADVRALRAFLVRAFPHARLFEADIPFVTRFLADNDVWTWLGAARSDMAPLVTMTFDIECAVRPEGYPDVADGRVITKAERPTRFPTAAVDPVTQIAAIVSTNDRIDDRCVFVLGSVDETRASAGVTFVSVPTETALFAAWAAHIQKYNPDFLAHYNGDGFDIPYMIARGTRIGATLAWGRDGTDVRSVRSYGGSRQTGKMAKFRTTIAGRVSYDMLNNIKASYKFESYTLNFVAGRLLGDVKDDVHHSMISPLHYSGPEGRARIARYCFQDALLTYNLYTKQRACVGLYAMAFATGVLPNDLLTRGQSVRVKTLILRYGNKAYFILPVAPNHDGDDNDDGKGKKYKGATVLDPETGFHTMPVFVLDFASLYPSIMCAHNLCYTTYVAPHERHLHRAEDLVMAPSGETFVRPEVRRGLLPMLLERTLAARKETRAKIPQTTDPFTRGVLDQLQIALKLVCNSVYGFTGASIGPLPLEAISRTVTAYGREMIELTRRKVEERFTRANGFQCDTRTLYGDSVTGDTPCIVRGANGMVALRRIDELAAEKRWKPWHGDKEAVDVDEMYVWSDRGWTRVQHVIRHLVPPSKRIVEVLTHSGVVKVTDEHSLLRPDGSRVLARDVCAGTELLHADLQHILCARTNIIRDVHEAWIMGFFMSSGYCKHERDPWCISKCIKPLMVHLFGLLVDIYPHVNFEFYDFRHQCGAYCIVEKGSGTTTFTARYRKMFYDSDGRKRVPTCILNAPRDIRESFFEGYYIGNDCNDVKCEIEGQIGAAGLFFLMASLGYTVSINTRANKPNVYKLTAKRQDRIQYARSCAIKKIREVTRDEDVFVYDLQTDNHHFQAGAGRIVVHNTDSVMVAMVNGTSVLTIDDAIAMGKEAAEYVTTSFRAPIKLEFEKVLWPYILFAKKRYIGGFWTRPERPDYVMIKGLEATRRENCTYVRSTVKGVLDRLARVDRASTHDSLMQNVVDAVAFAKERVGRLVRAEVTIDELIVTKSISKLFHEYAEKGKPAHIVLAERMVARDPATAPQPGTRVPFVFVCAGRGDKVDKRIEAPLYALEHNMPIDYNIYVEQLRKPLRRIFSFDPTIDVFVGAHMRRVVEPSGLCGRLAAMVRPAVRCAGCGVAMREASAGAGVVCADCEPRRAELEVEWRSVRYARIAASLERRDRCHVCVYCNVRDMNAQKLLVDDPARYAEIRAAVRADPALTQEGVDGAEACGNTDCSNFFPRVMARVAAEKACAELRREFNEVEPLVW